MEVFKQKYPKLGKVVELAIDCGLDVEYDINDVEQVLSWYNTSLQGHIRTEMRYNSVNIFDQRFMVELKNGDLSTITLRDYIISIIGENPIEAACCSPFIFRTDSLEYTMDENFKIAKWRFGVSEYDRRLSNGQKYTEALKDILTNENTRKELICDYNASDYDLIELYRLLNQLINSHQTDWQILKILEQSNLFNHVYCESLIPFIYDKGKKEYIEVTEILYS